MQEVKSLYAKYMSERFGYGSIESGEYFLIYEVCSEEDYIFIHDLYIDDSARGKSIQEIVDRVKSKLSYFNISKVYASVTPGLGDVTRTLMLYLRMGFSVERTSGEEIIIVRSL